jgi:hypothetical protein
MRSAARPRLNRFIIPAVLIIAGLQIALVCLPPFLPLVDLPTNLTNAYIFENHDTNALLSATFSVHSEPFPNLGFYYILSPMLAVIPAQTAAKVLCSIIIVLFGAGVLLLSRALHGRITWGAVIALFLIIGTGFQWGFLNYELGLGFFLVSLALWVRWRSALRPVRFGLLVLLAAACYLVHLSSIVFFAAAAAVWTIWDAKRGVPVKQLLLRLLPIVLLPALMFTMFMRGHGQTGIDWSVDPKQKLAWLVDLVSSYNRISAVIAIVLLAGPVYLLIRHRREACVHRVPASVALAFLAAYILCPTVFLTSWAADLRFVVPAAAFALLSITVNSESVALAKGRLLAAGLSLVFVAMIVRLGFIGCEWMQFSRTIGRQVSVMNVIPADSRVFVVQHELPDRWPITARLNTLPSYLVLYRHAVVSSHQAIAAQHPVSYKVPLYDGLIGMDREQPNVNWDSVASNYDYVWCSSITAATARKLSSIATLLGSDAGVSAYKIRR